MPWHVCFSLFVRVGDTGDLGWYVLSSTIAESNRRIQQMLNEHALWMEEQRAQQLAYQRVWHLSECMRLQNWLNSHSQLPASYPPCYRQVHWNPSLMHKLPMFYKTHVQRVNHLEKILHVLLAKDNSTDYTAT